MGSIDALASILLYMDGHIRPLKLLIDASVFSTCMQSKAINAIHVVPSLVYTCIVLSVSSLGVSSLVVHDLMRNFDLFVHFYI